MDAEALKEIAGNHIRQQKGRRAVCALHHASATAQSIGAFQCGGACGNGLILRVVEVGIYALFRGGRLLRSREDSHQFAWMRNAQWDEARDHR